MALVKCKECGGQVSTSAKVCQACGAPAPKKTKKLHLVFAGILLLFVFYAISRDKPTNQVAPSPAVAAQTPSGGTPGSQKAEAPAPKSAWSVRKSKDAMTDKEISFAMNESQNATQFEFPYKERGGSRLTLSFRRNGSELDAILSISKGQMMCSRLECGFELRVNDGPVQKWTGLEPSTNASDIMFVRDAKQLEEIVKKGGKIRIGVDFFQSGTRVFEFDVDGYPGV